MIETIWFNCIYRILSFLIIHRAQTNGCFQTQTLGKHKTIAISKTQPSGNALVQIAFKLQVEDRGLSHDAGKMLHLRMASKPIAQFGKDRCVAHFMATYRKRIAGSFKVECKVARHS